MLRSKGADAKYLWFYSFQINIGQPRKKEHENSEWIFPFQLAYLFISNTCFTGKGGIAAVPSQGVCRALSCECSLTSKPVNLGWHARSQNALWAGR